ncbi:unnamed protein product, partial [marine sediment metagenome]
MDYWEIRKEIQKIIPHKTVLMKELLSEEKGLIKEKGRKKNYKEFSLMEDK